MQRYLKPILNWHLGIDASVSVTRLKSQIPLFLRSAEPAWSTSPREVLDCNHIDVQCAQSLGISVETVAYSPDSVADYTLMLMLMVVRNAKSTISRAAGS